MADHFQYNLRRGLLGEGIISSWLRSRGWNVLPAYEVELGHGKGPRLYTAAIGELITPDLLAFKSNFIRWIEAKTKSAFTWYRINGCWQDGIDIHHWEDYCKVSDLTGWQVWLLFLHLTEAITKDTPDGEIPPRGLFGQEITKLRKSIDHQSDRHAKGMVYWNFNMLRRLADQGELIK